MKKRAPRQAALRLRLYWTRPAAHSPRRNLWTRDWHGARRGRRLKVASVDERGARIFAPGHRENLIARGHPVEELMGYVERRICALAGHEVNFICMNFERGPHEATS